MPTYTYACSACDVNWDEVVSISERDSPQPCPECGQPHTERLLAAPMVMNAAKPDSYRRGSSYEELKQIAKLKAARANMHPKKRDAVNTEIRDRQKIANTRRDKTD